MYLKWHKVVSRKMMILKITMKSLMIWRNNKSSSKKNRLRKWNLSLLWKMMMKKRKNYMI